MRPLLWTLILLGVPSLAHAQSVPVDVYGAAWCGPCRYVRSVLDKSGVSYRYHDVDSPAGRQRYLAARGARRGIPLVVIGNTKVVGANIEAIASALSSRGVRAASAPKRAGLYGGRPALWWQAQFRTLHHRLARLEASLRRLPPIAADNLERERRKRLKDDRQMVEDSIAQLDADASRVSLPRSYRR